VQNLRSPAISGWEAITMNLEASMSSAIANNASYEIRYRSLFDEGRGLAFPCDAKGLVNLDALSDAARNNYLYARALVGREFATPAVQLSDIG
jgi:hypothetical protein